MAMSRKEERKCGCSAQGHERVIRALSAAMFNIAPVRWQHPSHVAIVPPESKGKTEGNDWDTACGNFKTSISSIYYNKKCVLFFFITQIILK
jgi:hypothetical protein